MIQLIIILGIFYSIGWMFTSNPWLTVLKIWVVGWLICAVESLLSKPFRRKYSGSEAARLPFYARLKEFGIAVIGSLALTMLFWPGFVIGACEDVWPKLAVRLGLRPQWTLLQPNDIMHNTWTLADGTEFIASVSGYKAKEPAEFTADLESGSVSFRVRMVAPKELPPTEWKRMRRMSREEWAYETEEEESLDETPPLRSHVKFDKGRYIVDFRVEAFDKQQEFSGLILILI